MDDIFGDRDATAEAIANEIRAEGEAARARYIQLGLPTPPLKFKLQCRTLDIFGVVDVRRAITLGPDNIQLPVRDIEDAFLEGIAAPGAALGANPSWQSPTAAWRDTIHHEAFHAVQMEIWVALGGLYTFRNYFMFQNITASESTATLAQDLFNGVDDSAAAPLNSYLQKTEQFFNDKPSIEAFNSDAPAYEAGAVFQYWAERFGPNQGDDLEQRVADFSRLLIGTNKIRTDAMEEALGRDVFEALRDFYVTAYVHDRAQAPGPYAFLDEITAHGALPGIGDGQEYPPLATVNSALADADFPNQLLGQGRGEVYDIALPPAAASVEVSLQSRATGGVEILGTKIGQNWSPVRTAFVTVDANGAATIDPALMPNGPHPQDDLTRYIVDVAGKSRLGIVVVAGEDDADYDLQVRLAGVADVSIVAPTTIGPRVIGPATDLEDFEVIVDATLNGIVPAALRTTNFAVTVGGLSGDVKSVLPTVTGRFKLLVEPPAGLVDGRYPLAVDFLGALDSETDAIIVGEAPRAAVSLVIDKSGSMGGARIAAAKAAAVQFVQQMELNDILALVTFDSSAYVNRPLTMLSNETVRQQFIDSINAISAGGGTNIAAGLSTGNQQLAGAAGSGASRAILLLTDGLDSSNVDAVIAQIPADVDAHTIALDTGSDQAKLQHIADATGGVFLFAPSPADLANLYSLIRAQITNTELRQLSLGAIGQGGSATASFPIAVGGRTAVVGITWAGSDFDLTLELPSGRTITETTQAPDVVVRSGPDFVTIEVSEPEAGVWHATVVGADVPTPEDVTLRIEEQGSDVTSTLALEAAGDAGAPILARLALTGATGAVDSASVLASMVRPDGSTVTAPMFDDGGHRDGFAGDGVFGASLSTTAQSGSYTVTVDANGADNGYEFSRQEVASIFLSPATDSDGDGISDETELRLGLDSADSSDATADLDGDGLGTLTELSLMTDPLRRDSDGGGESDGSESAASRNPLDRADDFELPEVFARVIPGDGRVFTIYTMTSDATGAVHIQRVGPSETTDLGNFSGEEQSITDGPLLAGVYSYRFSAAASGAESAPVTVGPFTVVEDATPPSLVIEINDGVWEATSADVAVRLTTSEPVSDMRLGETLDALAAAEWQPFGGQFTYQFGSEAGIKRLYVQVRDVSGNVSTPSVDAVYLAGSPPQVTFSVVSAVDGPPPPSGCDPICPESAAAPSTYVYFNAAGTASHASATISGFEARLYGVRADESRELLFDWLPMSAADGTFDETDEEFMIDEERLDLGYTWYDFEVRVSAAGQTATAVERVLINRDTTAPVSVAGPAALPVTEGVNIPITASDNRPGQLTVELWARHRPNAVSAWTSWSRYSSGPYNGNPDYSVFYIFDSGDGGYEFRSIAIDALGNRETAPPVADTSATRDAVNDPPAVSGTFTATKYALGGGFNIRVEGGGTAVDDRTNVSVTWALYGVKANGQRVRIFNFTLATAADGAFNERLEDYTVFDDRAWNSAHVSYSVEIKATGGGASTTRTFAVPISGP